MSNRTNSQFFFLILTLGICTNLGCQQSPWHKPDMTAADSVTLQVKSCDQKSGGLARVAHLMTERLELSGILYQSVIEDSKMERITLNVIGSKEHPDDAIDYDNLLDQDVKLKMVIANRIGDEKLSDIVQEIINKEGLSNSCEINSRNFLRYPESVLASCSLDEIMNIQLIFKRYEDKHGIEFYWQKSNFHTNEAPRVLLYCARKEDELYITEKEVAQAIAEQDQYTGEQVVSLRFNETGAQKFSAMTTKAANDNRRAILIIVNDQVKTAPSVMSPIEGGRATIASNFSKEESVYLAHLLTCAALPCEITLVK